MSSSNTQKLSWLQVLKSWTHPRVIAMLFLGFSAGLPILLIFSTLSLWLREAGVERSAVTFFSWAALGYSFKFVWAPLIDKLPFPYLSKKMGRRRSWLLVSQAMIIIAIICMGMTDPRLSQNNLQLMALFAVLLGFSSATQDIVIDAYRIECMDETFQALLASTYIAGYRIGMVVAGAGSLFIASYFGSTAELYDFTSWQKTYFIMAATMLVGVCTTLIVSEPETDVQKNMYPLTAHQYVKIFLVFLIGAIVFCMTFFLSGNVAMYAKSYLSSSLGMHVKLSSFVIETLRLALAFTNSFLAVFIIVIKTGFIESEVIYQTYVAPLTDFFKRYGLKTAVLLLLLVGFYRVSDIVLGVISNVFYMDMGFSKNIIGGITKAYGLGMTIAGGFIGGFLTLRFGVIKILFLGALLSSVTNLFFLLLAQSGSDITILTMVIAIDNLSGGLAAAAFVAFLSSLTSISFTAVQYALFSSLMTLFPKLLGGYSGTMVNTIGYPTFFVITCLMGVPVLLLVWLAGKRLR